MTGSPRIPWIGEFTPGQLGPNALKDALGLVAAHSGDQVGLEEAIRIRWFADAAPRRSDPEERREQQRKRSGNVIIGLRSLGLIDENAVLTELGRELLSLPDREAARLFAAFLLREREGVALLEAARAVAKRQSRVTKKAVQEELKLQGFSFTVNSADTGKLRQWLQTAHIVDSRWAVDEPLVAQLLGTPLRDLEDWQCLTSGQQAVLAILRERAEGSDSPISSPDLVGLLRDRGVPFDESQLKKSIYQPLADGGWIIHTVPPRGRGGKGGIITPTPRLLAIDLSLVTGGSESRLPTELRRRLNTPIEDIDRDLNSNNTHEKGIALELLALRLAAELGLLPVDLRVRGTTTGGAEVDLVAEGTHIHFSRWLFQCKNTPKSKVTVDVLLKEVGIATLLRAHVIVLVTTGSFAHTVVEAVQRLSQETPLQVVLIDGPVLRQFRKSGASALRAHFSAAAEAARRAKRPQLLDLPEPTQ
jgi:hypothetical protein